MSLRVGAARAALERGSVSRSNVPIFRITESPQTFWTSNVAAGRRPALLSFRTASGDAAAIVSARKKTTDEELELHRWHGGQLDF